MIDMTEAEQEAVRVDAQLRLSELLTLEAELRPEIDDCSESMSEWTWVRSQIAAARQVLEQP